MIQIHGNNLSPTLLQNILVPIEKIKTVVDIRNKTKVVSSQSIYSFKKLEEYIYIYINFKTLIITKKEIAII